MPRLKFACALFAPVLAFALGACASGPDSASPAAGSAFVLIGLAEAADAAEPRYSMLWRRLNAEGQFAERAAEGDFEVRTNDGGAVRLEGVPGEFTLVRVPAGAYALDSIFAEVSDGALYYANGLILGPARPSFEVAAGEAVYLGIWQAWIEGALAKTALWRLQEADARAFLDAPLSRARAPEPLVLRSAHLREIPCTPSWYNSRTQRQTC